MDDTALHAAIKKLSVRITDEEIPLLVSCAQKQEFKKGDVLLKEGNVCRTFYFVEKGYLRTWYNKDGVPINLNFAFEGEFTTNLRSLKGRKPSDLTIEAGEDVVVSAFNVDAINTLPDAQHYMSHFIRRLAIHVLLASEEHSNLFKLYTPTERYHYIEQNNPKLLQRISLSQMASYLGVTRETLSRIRAKK
jgi:CRP-like cAMP-binding protein